MSEERKIQEDFAVAAWWTVMESIRCNTDVTLRSNPDALVEMATDDGEGSLLDLGEMEGNMALAKVAISPENRSFFAAMWREVQSLLDAGNEVEINVAPTFEGYVVAADGVVVLASDDLQRISKEAKGDRIIDIGNLTYMASATSEPAVSPHYRNGLTNAERREVRMIVKDEIRQLVVDILADLGNTPTPLPTGMLRQAAQRGHHD